jgi:hypothetical protein
MVISTRRTSCGGNLSIRDMASRLLVAGIPGGLCIPIRYHACNMATPRRFGFTGFVIYTTFFVELNPANPACAAAF